jgi:hypothetical protein
MDRTRSVLTAAAAALVLALLTACGDDARDRTRERVDDYAAGEQQVMRRAEPEFRRANETFLAYARGELSHEAAAREAARAERSILDARDGVAVLDPPAEAQALHDRLVSYLQMNVDVARETQRLAAYLPAAERALRPLPRANRTLETRLAGAKDSDAQEEALARFHESVETALADLRKLEPPAVLVPAHDDQTRGLARSGRLAGDLRRALDDQDAARVARLLGRFRAGAPQRRPRRLPARQALAAYDRRLQQINNAYAEIQREQVALGRKLG